MHLTAEDASRLSFAFAIPRFFGGDPVRNAMILYNFYDCKPLMDRVLGFLQQDD
jgi:hypothetical protein